MNKNRPWQARFNRWIYLTSLPIPYFLRTIALDLLMPNTRLESNLALPNVRLRLNPADSLQANMLLDGYWDRPLSNWLAFFAPYARVCADIGTHVGYFTVLMARYAAPGVVVHGFEPNPDTFAQLRENAALNGVQLVANNCAVSDAPGMVEMEFPHPFLYGSVRMGKAYHAVRKASLPSIDLDGYCAQHGLTEIDLIKMDIEGAEVLAFAGMREGVRQQRYGALLVELHENFVAREELQRTIYQPLLEAGYRIYEMKPDRLLPVTEVSPSVTLHMCALSPRLWEKVGSPTGEILLAQSDALPFAVGAG